MTAVNASNPSTQAFTARQLPGLDDPASAASQAKRVGPGLTAPPKKDASQPAPPASNRPSPLSPEQKKKAATDAVNAFLDENDVLKDKVRDIQFSKTILTQLEKDVLQNKAREWVRHLQEMAIRTAQEYLDAQLKKHPTEVIAKKQAPPVGVPYEKEHPEVTRARDLLEQALQSDLGIAVATEREEYGKLNQYELANKQLKEAKTGSRQYADAQNRANRIAAELPGYSEKSVQAWLVVRSHERGDTAKARRCQKSLDAAQVRLDWARKLAPQSLQEIGPPTQRSSY